jgi:hypothetical protein
MTDTVIPIRPLTDQEALDAVRGLTGKPNATALRDSGGGIARGVRVSPPGSQPVTRPRHSNGRPVDQPPRRPVRRYHCADHDRSR